MGALQSSFHKRIDRWSGRADPVGGQKLDDGFPRLTFVSSFEDQVEVAGALPHPTRGGAEGTAAVM